MRILSEDKDEALNRVTIYLTMDEAGELRDSVEALLAGPIGRHEHIPNEDYRKELAICLYDPGILDGLNERSRRLIVEDA